MTDKQGIAGEFFKRRARIMQAEINAVRKIINHALSKGVEAESALSDLFESILPARFNARKGFLLDSAGNLSHEMDLIIVDRLHVARMFDFRSFDLVPVEAASGCVEVKTTLTKHELEDTFERFRKIHEMEFVEERLLFTQSQGGEAGLFAGKSTRPDLTLFAYDSSVSLSAIREIYEKHKPLEFVKICILSKGNVACISHSRNGLPSLRWIEPCETDEEALAGSVLAQFLYHLYLPTLLAQRKGTEFYIGYLSGESDFKELC